jgi:hypothetical protein
LKEPEEDIDRAMIIGIAVLSLTGILPPKPGLI